MSRAARNTLLLPLLALAAGCSSFEQRVVAVESRQASLEAQVADLQASQQNLIARLVQIQQDLDNALQPLRTQNADRGEDLRGMRREVTALEEEITQLQSRIEQITEQFASSPARGTERAPVGSAMPPPRGSRGNTGESQAPATSAEAPVDSEATRLYNSAFNDYMRDNWDLCIQGFEEYIRRYGRSERADNAQYWIGLCQRDRGRPDAARQAFDTLIREYPRSELIPDAMLNDALILKSQGRSGAATDTLRRLIAGYVNSDAAFLACGQLRELGATLPPSCDELP